MLATALIALVAISTANAAVARVGASLRADAHAVIEWNDVAATTLAALPWPVGGSPAALQINLAMTQGAVYDAVNAIGPERYEPYLLRVRFAVNGSIRAAVATAAYEVLTNIVSTAPPFVTKLDVLVRLSMRYAAALREVPGGISRQQGIAAGRAAADATLESREDDGRFGASPWDRDTRPGHWSPPLGASGREMRDPTPWVGGVRPFLVENPSQFRSAAPLPLDSAGYAADLREVRSLGRATGSTRTEMQTMIAEWWQWAPARAWNSVARELLSRGSQRAVDASRVLALQNLSGADAAITCGNDSYRYDLWRPETAIARAGDDGNVATVAEPGWASLLTATYPEHPSIESCVGAAHVTVLRMFFGDVIRGGFVLTSMSTALTTEGRERTFTTFSQPLAELLEAGVCAGLSFRHAVIEGQRVGVNVAEYAASHHLRSAER